MIVFCTVPNEDVSKELATALVKEGLCACINQTPGVKSFYIYEGEFCEDEELLLMIKTAPSHYKRLEQRIKELHPYDVPEIIATEISEVSAEYASWLKKALS